MRRLARETLEDRLALTAISWINPAGGAWDVGSNWSGGSVPTSSDDVTIDTASAATITVQAGDGLSVNSLTTGAGDTLSFSGGSLTVAGDSTLSGPLVMAGGSLSASGAGAKLIANGAASISGANLSATSGGTLSLPQLTGYTSNGNYIQADGAGSVLDLSALQSVTHSGNFGASATNGGKLDLSSLKSLAGSGNPDDLRLTDTGDSTILDGKLTSLDFVYLSMDGSDQQVADSWTRFTNGFFNVTAGAYTLPGLTDADGTGFLIRDGGRLALPGVTNFVAGPRDSFVEGAGSVLDMSALTSESGGWPLIVDHGGEVKLTGLTAMTDIYIAESGGSTVLDGNVTSVSHSSFQLDGSDPQVASSWTSFTDGGISVKGGSYDLSRMTTFENSSASASQGGKLTLGGVTDLGAGRSTFSADGAGSTLDLSALVNVAQTAGASFNATHGGRLLLAGLTDLTSGNAYNVQLTDTGGSAIVDDNLTDLSGVVVQSDGSDAHLADAWTRFVNGKMTVSGGSTTLSGVTDADGSYLQAIGGGSLTLPALTTYDTASALYGSQFEADGNGSSLELSALNSVGEQSGRVWNVNVTGGGQIKLPALTSLAGTANRHLSVSFTGSGAIVDAQLTNLSYVNVTLDGAGTQAGEAWSSLAGGTIFVYGGDHSLPALTNLNGSSVYVWNGGKLSLPVLTDLTPNNFSVFEVSGAGSELDLSALTSFHPNAAWNLGAHNGGEINLTSLASLDGGYIVSIIDGGHSSIVAPNLTSLNHVNVWTDGTDPQLGSDWTSFTGSGLNLGETNANDPTAVTAGALSLPNLVDADGSSFAAQDGGSLDLPVLAPTSMNVNLSADGPGSTLTAAALSSITAQYQCRIQATNGGDVELPALSTINAYHGIFSIIDTNHSTVLLPASLTTLNGVSVTLDGTDNHLPGAWTSFTDGAFTITGGSYNLSQLTNVDGSSFSVEGGGSLVLPVVVSDTSNAASFEAVGAGSVLNAPALASVSPSGGWTVRAAGGGAVKLHGLTSVTNGDGVNFTAQGGGVIELPSLTSLSDPTNASVTVGDGGAVAWGGRTVKMPSAGSGLAIIVSALPVDVPINLSSTGTFQDTTFFIGAAQVNITDGTFAGHTTLNVYKRDTLDLTGGNLVNYSGTLGTTPATEFGTVRLASGGVAVGAGGLTLDFPPRMFQWTGGEFYASSEGVTNAGCLEIGPGQTLTDTGDLINRGALTIDAGGRLAIGGDFEQTSGGALAIYMAGSPVTGQFSQMAVNGAATLDGSVSVNATGGFVPQDGEDFPVMNFASESGNFSNVGVGSGFRERLQPTSLDFVTVLHDDIDSPLGATLNAIEGATVSGNVASFSNANPLTPASDYTARIDWGDGNTTTGSVSTDDAGGFTVSGSHVYAEEGTKPLTVSIYSLLGNKATIHGQAFVSEAAISGSGTTFSLGQDVSLSHALVASFTHGVGDEPAASFTASIDWGDGQSSAGAISESNGTYAVSGSHAYSQPGSFAIKTTISEDGVSTVLSGSAKVASVGTPHERYVTAVYEDVLGRAPDAGGLAYWTRRLDQGAAISSVAESIAHSDEYYANFVIRPDYLKLLGRAADDASVSYWTSQLQGGLTDQQLEANLVGSGEFFYKAGGTNAGWIDSVYRLLLDRAASAAEVSYWNSRLSAGQTLSQASRSIAESPENNSRLINDDYFHYLGRDSDAGGLHYWLEQFAAGKTNEDLIAGFTGSTEYYKQHTS